MPHGARLALAASLAPRVATGGADPTLLARAHIQVASHGLGPTRVRQNNSRAEHVVTICESLGFQLTGRQTRDDSDRTVDIA